MNEDVPVVENFGVRVELLNGFGCNSGASFGAAEFFGSGGFLKSDQWKGRQVGDFFRGEGGGLTDVHVAGDAVPAEGGH